MPHYANGSEVKVGDYVKGKPHNSPHEITGVVVYYQPNQEKCNIHVAHARPFRKGDHHLGVGDRTVHVRVDPNISGSGVTIDVDYGQAEDFEPLPAPGQRPGVVTVSGTQCIDGSCRADFAEPIG